MTTPAASIQETAGVVICRQHCASQQAQIVGFVTLTLKYFAAG